MIDKNLVQTYLQDHLPDYLDILRRMVGINSFTSNPRGVNQLGLLTAQLFEKFGCQAEFAASNNPEFGNHLFLRRPAKSASAPGIVMVSHLDTVFPPEEEIANQFFWRIENERVFGPGTVDIKGGTVVIYMIFDILQQQAPRLLDSANWLIALDASEETLSGDFGSLTLKRAPANALACLIFEGGSPGSDLLPIVVARKGRATFTIQVQGRSAHAGNHHAKGANAIAQISQTIQEAGAITDYARQLTVNVGTVSGGSVVNRVPHFAQAELEMRAFSMEVFDQACKKILALAGPGNVTSTDGYTCQVSILPGEQSAPWPRNAATDALFEIWKETANQLNLQVVPEERGGLSDGNLLWKALPTLDGLGPVGDYAHCSERSEDGSKEQEFALIPSFVEKATLNTLAILNLLKKYDN
jgi:glutamate carboxypeptidase